MRIAGNKIKHLRDFYFAELRSKFDEGEINAIFQTAVSHYLGINTNEVLLKMEEHLNQSDLLKIYDCAKDVKKDIPLQYILGEAWFYNLPFKVNASVLIPRPETEELVELILKDFPSLQSLLDIGCGSGCIPVAIKKNRPSATVSACEVSAEALELAGKNAELNQAPVSFLQIDILSEEEINQQFQVIVSNPPYIKKDERKNMAANVVDHEPELALFVEGDDAIIFYRKIIDRCKTNLLKGGSLYFELNPLTAEEVRDYADKSDLFLAVELRKDLSGNIRIFRGVKK